MTYGRLFFFCLFFRRLVFYLPEKKTIHSEIFFEGLVVKTKKNETETVR